MILAAILASAYSFGLLGDIHYDADYLHNGTGFYKGCTPNYRADWIVHELPHLKEGAEVFAREPKAAFVLQTGDLVSGGSGSVELQTRMLDEAWNLVRPLYAGLGPFYVINGNHETYDFEAPGTYAYPGYAASIQKRNAAELGRESCERHFWFRQGPDLFVGYNSNVDEYDFVKEAFEKNPDARWVFTVGHIPTISPVPGGIEIDSPECGNLMENHDRFLKLLQSRNAILLCGDTHRIGFLDYVTGDGRFSQVMGVAVWQNGPYVERATRPDEYTVGSGPFYSDLTPRKRHLKPGLVRYWQADGKGCWKLHVSDESVVAEWYAWDDAAEPKKRIVVRGPEEACASVKLVLPETPLAPGVNKCRLEGAAQVTGDWKFSLPAGWAIRNFKPAEGTLNLVLPETPHLTRTKETIVLRCLAKGRVVANEVRHLYWQDVIEAKKDSPSDLPIPFFGGFTTPARGNPSAYCLAFRWSEEGLRVLFHSQAGDFREGADVSVSGADKWLDAPALELFVDPLNRKETAVSSDTVQLVLFPVKGGKCRATAIRYPQPAGKGPMWARFGVGVADDGAPTWTADPEGFDGGVVVDVPVNCEDASPSAIVALIPWSAIAPASDPTFVPKEGALIGLDAAWCNRPLLGFDRKLWDDPSTWATIRLGR